VEKSDGQNGKTCCHFRRLAGLAAAVGESEGEWTERRCLLQEGVTRSSFYRWYQRLKSGVPESMIEEEADRQQAESEQTGQAIFLPVSLKASPVEIEMPNGGIVRLPLGVGQAALIAVIEAVGLLRPWKAPTS
jgi:hypothetical protein